ncbi:MAG: CDP-alcohol phosphatidyltransferase family protein [Chloroflexi bacterium]|nr:CDP-alcohol phosphatidyltransferase family protein [Chloroflexota bacterium]
MTDKMTFTDRLRRATDGIVNPVARGLAKAGVRPAMLTTLGAFLTLVAGVLAAAGLFRIAGLALLLGAPFDAIDGAVARALNRETDFGALLDSTFDRYSDAFVLGGIALWMARSGAQTGVGLAIAALFGAVMVSYLRARSEGLRIDNRIGLMTRVERTLVLILMLALQQVMIGLWILAIFTHVTVVQRLLYARKQL